MVALTIKNGNDHLRKGNRRHRRSKPSVKTSACVGRLQRRLPNALSFRKSFIKGPFKYLKTDFIIFNILQIVRFLVFVNFVRSLSIYI